MFFKQGAGTTEYIYMQNNEVGPVPYTIYKHYSKQSNDLNVLKLQNYQRKQRDEY